MIARLPSLSFFCIASALVASTTVGARSSIAADHPSSAQADRDQLARRLYSEGEAAFNAGQYETALKDFEDGYAASPRPGFLLNMAHTERKLGELRKARSLYKRFLLIDPTSRVADEVRAVIEQLDSALADEEQAQRREGAAAPQATPAKEAAARSATQSRVAAGLPSAPAPAVPAAPILTATDSAAPPAGAEHGTPAFYRRAWFWIAVGVVVAAGTGTALYMSGHSSGDPFHASGSLGSIGP